MKTGMVPTTKARKSEKEGRDVIIMMIVMVMKTHQHRVWLMTLKKTEVVQTPNTTQ